MMHSILITWLSVFIPLGSLFFIGLPVAILLIDKKERELLWVSSPFLGLAVIVLFLQNLVYLGVPIAKSFYSVWIVGVCGWFILIKTNMIKKILPIPILLLLAAFCIYLFQALGMLVVSPAYYVGHGWYDQFNYVSVSQLLMDHSLLGLHLSDLSNQPSALRAFLLAVHERIGQDVFQGFIASSLFVSAKTSFEPVILMLPFLLVLVMYQIAKQFDLSSGKSLLIAMLGASLPSVALIHLESFLSQALIAPILLLWPSVLMNLFARIHWQSILMTALLLALVASVYTEFYFIFIFLGLCFCLMVIYSSKSFKPFLALFVMVFIALCLNPVIVGSLLSQTQSAIAGRNFARIYPWVQSLDALHWLWLGEFTLTLKAGWKILADIFSIIFFVSAYLGFVISAYKKPNAYTITFVIVLLLPVMVWLCGVSEYGYQFYKLLITLSPLLPLGVVLACKYLFAKRPHYKEVAAYLSVLVGVFILSATLFMILFSTNQSALAYLKRGVGYKLLQADTREIQDTLADVTNQDILIVWQDEFRQGDFINGWLTYFARNNRVWLVNTLVGDKNLRPYLADFKTLPQHYLLLTSASYSPKAEKLWKNKTYALWRV